MNKKFILLFSLLFGVASVEAGFIDTLFVYMKNCTHKFSSFFVVTPAKQLAQPKGTTASFIFDSKQVYLGESCKIIPKKFEAKRNKFDTQAFVQNSDKYYDHKFCEPVDQTIGGSIVIPIDYDKIDTHFELVPCGKGDKFTGERFINKKINPSVLETFDASRPFV